MSAHARVAYDPEWAEYESGGHKLLSDNRDLYVSQSAATRGGVVATFPRAATLPAAQPAPAGCPQAGNYSQSENAK